MRIKVHKYTIPRQHSGKHVSVFVYACARTNGHIWLLATCSSTLQNRGRNPQRGVPVMWKTPKCQSYAHTFFCNWEQMRVCACSCVCMFVCVRAFVCAYMREGAQERERKTERKEKLCHYASIKQKAQWCHSAVCFVSLCVHLCVRMYVGVLVCVCVLFLAVSSQCVLFSFPNETLTIIFSKGESKDSKRDQGWCVVWTLLSVCVCVCFWELCIRVLLAKAVTLHDQSA